MVSHSPGVLDQTPVICRSDGLVYGRTGRNMKIYISYLSNMVSFRGEKGVGHSQIGRGILGNA